jgi:hypothetical protein
MIQDKINAIVQKHYEKSIIITKEEYRLATKERKGNSLFPQTYGVYFVCSKNGFLNYIGWSSNIPNRCPMHFAESQGKFKYGENYKIRIISGKFLNDLENELNSLISKYYNNIVIYDIEHFLILLYKPNRNGYGSHFRYPLTTKEFYDLDEYDCIPSHYYRFQQNARIQAQEQCEGLFGKYGIQFTKMKKRESNFCKLIQRPFFRLSNTFEGNDVNSLYALS